MSPTEPGANNGPLPTQSNPSRDNDPDGRPTDRLDQPAAQLRVDVINPWGEDRLRITHYPE